VNFLTIFKHIALTSKTNIGVTWLITLEGWGDKLDHWVLGTLMYEEVKLKRQGRWISVQVFHLFLSLHHPNNRSETFYFLFAPPQLSSQKKNLFLGIKNIGRAFPPLHPPSYTYAHKIRGISLLDKGLLASQQEHCFIDLIILEQTNRCKKPYQTTINKCLRVMASSKRLYQTLTLTTRISQYDSHLSS
jgi:hypothetical protein